MGFCLFLGLLLPYHNPRFPFPNPSRTIPKPFLTAVPNVNMSMFLYLLVEWGVLDGRWSLYHKGSSTNFNGTPLSFYSQAPFPKPNCFLMFVSFLIFFFSVFL